MLYTLESARDRIRTRDGKRVFLLTPGDRLTPSAREYLDRERVEILTVQSDTPTEYKTLFGAVLTHKPEHMTHLTGTVLVFKDHPRIAFRGMIDSLEAQILLCAQAAQQQGQMRVSKELAESLDYVRRFIRCDVLGEPLQETTLCGLTDSELRERSHHPERYYDQSHFMPSVQDDPLLLQVNLLRTLTRQTELAAYRAFRDENGAVRRNDILQGLNRLSSFYWIMMIRLKCGDYEGGTKT